LDHPRQARFHQRLPDRVAGDCDVVTEVVEDLHSQGHRSVVPACAWVMMFFTSSTVSEVFWFALSRPVPGLFLLAENRKAS